MNRSGRNFAVFLIFTLLVGAVLAAAGGVLWLRTSLPQTSGEIILRGPDEAVEIRRDARGVPLIRAASARDAYFALGFVHAQDRLFQMDMMRRAGAGRLAEVLGEALLAHDREMRLLGLYRLAERSLAYLSPEVGAALASYSAGVNAYLDNHKGALPPEFMALGYRPEAWRPADSLVWCRHMAFKLSGNRNQEMLRARLSDRLSPEQIEALWPPYPEDAAVGVSGRKTGIGVKEPASTHASLIPSIYRGLALDALWRALPAAAETYGASNNWVLSGSHTRSGKPILANDPHLWLSTPGAWYLAVIEAPDLAVAGATAPGMPFTILGHNRRIAWGLTTTHSDTQDLFIERIDPADPGRYLTPEGSRPFVTRIETILVRGGGKEVFTVRETRHGPVLTDMLEHPPGGFPESGYIIALADAALRDEDLTAQALYRLNRAQDWESFTAALRDIHAPQQNIVYADTEGNIGFYAPALVPLRRKGDGFAPVPGWSGEYDWTGFIPFEELPHAYNPASGRIVTANNRVVDKDYPYLLSARWGAPYRARRIHERLDAVALHSLESTQALQNDAISLAARDLLPLMLDIEGKDEPTRSALDLMRAWDGKMERNAPQPLIFSAWLKALQRLIAGDELQDLYAALSPPRPLFVKSVLSRNRGWCDDVSTPESESCRALIALALDQALAALKDAFGADMEGWRWGEAHKARFVNPMLELFPLLGPWLRKEVATDGADDTVNRGSFLGTAAPGQFAHVHGAGLRAVYDLADLERSRFMIVPGQSGNLFSPHAGDLVEAWRDGRTFTLPAAGRKNRGDAGRGEGENGGGFKTLVLRPAQPADARE